MYCLEWMNKSYSYNIVRISQRNLAVYYSLVLLWGRDRIHDQGLEKTSRSMSCLFGTYWEAVSGSSAVFCLFCYRQVELSVPKVTSVENCDIIDTALSFTSTVMSLPVSANDVILGP